MFDDIRSQMMGKKRGRKPGCCTDSKVDSSDHNNVFDTPQLSKHIYQLTDRIRTHDARLQRRSADFEAQESHEKDKCNGSHGRIQQQSPSEDQKDKTRRKTRREECPIQSRRANLRGNRGKPRGRRRREVSPLKSITPEPSKFEQEEFREKKQEQSLAKPQSESSESSSSNQQSCPKEKAYVRNSRPRRGKRRARRIVTKVESEIIAPSIQRQFQKEASKMRPIESCPGGTKVKNSDEEQRQQLKQNSNLMVEESRGATGQIPDDTRQNILQRVKFFLKNRQELVQTLIKIPVTTENIKEILDLGVTDIIREGQITNQIRLLLQYLKSMILYKYFPQDAKIRKKYDKLVKKRISSSRFEQKKIDEGYTLTNEDIQIRKKTIKKLETIIRSETKEDSKDCAHKIETYFRRRDQTIGDGYRDLAYRILRNLKDKIESVQQVLGKLEADDYD